MIAPTSASGVPTAAQQRTWRVLSEKLATQLVAALNNHWSAATEVTAIDLGWS